MRLRPSPLVEAASTFAISFLVVIGWFTFFNPQGTDAGSMATYAAMLVMFPIFTVIAIAGFAVRSRTSLQRFLVNTAIALLLSLVAALLQLSWGSVWLGTCLLVFIATVVALAVTYRFVIDYNKVKLSNTQYSSNPVVSRKSKRKKK